MMRGFFRRHPKLATPDIDPADKLIAAFSGFTETEWAELPELVRRDAREHITWRL